ncbi:hypothetical protein ACSAZL_11795 [Methanosarcina sp. T3]|uniref:hypothetical protein n=1 Tax=Methanosarcina sp. T3 TaxID=3439062 RepID=UPI003F82A0C4
MGGSGLIGWHCSEYPKLESFVFVLLHAGLNLSLLPHKKEATGEFILLPGETEFRTLFPLKRILPLTSGTSSKFIDKYSMYPPACLAAFQRKEEKIDLKDKVY